MFRGGEAERLEHFVSRIKKRYVGAELIHEPPTLSMVEGSKQYIFIRSLRPSCWEEMHGRPQKKNLKIPPEVRHFNKMDTVNIFVATKQMKTTKGSNELRVRYENSRNFL